MISPEDLLVTMHDRHEGGQRAGMSGIGVRVEHVPTGTIAIVMGSRSQHRLKGIAVRMIEAALTDPEFGR